MEKKYLSVRREGNLYVKCGLTSVFRVLGVSALTTFFSLLSKKKNTSTYTQINHGIFFLYGYRVFLLSPHRAGQFYCTENLYPPDILRKMCCSR